MKWTFILLGLAYPALMLVGLKWFDPRYIALAVAGVAAVRLFRARRTLAGRTARLLVPATSALVLLIGLAVLFNEARFLLALPVLINGVLFAVFGWSLVKPPPIVETLARIQVVDLSAEEMHYCRAVTGVWCGFFVLNGSIIVWLAWRASPSQWALYTGFISYLLIGALFAVELAYRHYRFRRYIGAPTDPLFRKLFPPRESH